MHIHIYTYTTMEGIIHLLGRVGRPWWLGMFGGSDNNNNDNNANANANTNTNTKYYMFNVANDCIRSTNNNTNYYTRLLRVQPGGLHEPAPALLGRPAHAAGARALQLGVC